MNDHAHYLAVAFLAVESWKDKISLKLLSVLLAPRNKCTIVHEWPVSNACTE